MVMKSYIRKNLAGILSVAMLASFPGNIRAASEIQSTAADNYNYQNFIDKGLLPQIGSADLKTTEQPVSANNMTDLVAWDTRKGYVTSAAGDFNKDGIKDLMVFYFAPAGSDAQKNGRKQTALYAGLYTHQDKKVTLLDSTELFSDNNIGYRNVRLGIMDMDGQKVLYVEENVNAYFADGSNLTYTWYGCDGKNLRPLCLVGKTDGGSSEVAYSILTYKDEENYDKEILWADSSYLAFHKDQVPLCTGEVGDALIQGFKKLNFGAPTLSLDTEAGYSVYSFTDETFPTFWETNLLEKVISYKCSGTGDYSLRNMKVEIEAAEFKDITVSAGGTQSQTTGTSQQNNGQTQNTEAQNAQNPPQGTAEEKNVESELFPITVTDSYEMNAESQGQTGFQGQSQTNQNQSEMNIEAIDMMKQQSGQNQQSPSNVIPAQPVVKKEYFFPDGNARYLTSAEVNQLSLQAVCFAKNEFYARHGRQFKSQELRDFFNARSWYQGTIAPESFSDSVFNAYEQANIDLLSKREHQLAANGYALDLPGYDITAVEIYMK